jgi:hypothetical protein
MTLESSEADPEEGTAGAAGALLEAVRDHQDPWCLCFVTMAAAATSDWVLAACLAATVATSSGESLEAPGDSLATGYLLCPKVGVTLIAVGKGRKSKLLSSDIGPDSCMSAFVARL